MSDNKSRISNNTLTTQKKEKNYDTIPMRIEFIKLLLNDKQLKPMVNFDDTVTDNFISKNNSDDSQDSHDTRSLLKKKILNFENTITQIGGKLQYIKSGTTGHTFKGIVDEKDNEFNYAVKVVAYPRKEKYGSIHDARRPENAELMTIKLLSYFVVNKQTPHIVLPIGTFNASIKSFVSLIEDKIIDDDNKKYAEFIEKYKENEYHDEVSILISEWANRGDLLDFIRNNYTKFKLAHWKVIFFQLISALAVIQSKFPNFRHNDLKANNILVHKINRKTNNHAYKVDGKDYMVPNIGYQIKLWDFDFACVPGIVDNIKVTSDWTKTINVTPEKNRYYDMHYFFNTFIKKGFFPQFTTEPNSIPKEVRDFVNRIVPPQYQSGPNIHKRGRILINKEYLLPKDVLQEDPFFEEFRKPQTEKIKMSDDIGKLTSDFPKMLKPIVKEKKNSKTTTKTKSSSAKKKPRTKNKKIEKPKDDKQNISAQLDKLLLNSD